MPELPNYVALLPALVGVEYVCVVAAVLADLRSGVLKARRLGEAVTSGGYRRTVEKASRYFITLIGMTLIDVMLLAAVVYLRAVAGWGIPPFPLFTTVGAAGLGMIELKSIYENSRERGDYDMIVRALRRMIADEKFRKALSELLKG